LIKSKYLHGKASSDLDGSLTSGWLTKKIAYLHIADLKRGKNATPKAVDAIIKRFADAKGFVVDVRLHLGGNGNTATFVANRFADRMRHYMISRTRYGKSHDDFPTSTYRNVRPDGPIQFTRPTIVLTHRFTESAGETFVMAMGVLPHVTVLGEQTAGALGSQYSERMPNGWRLGIPFIANLDHNGVCWNGIGLAPDMHMVNTKADIDAGNDEVLEFATQLLQDGNLKPQDESSSLKTVKKSIVETFDRIVREKGLDDAIREVEQIRASKNEEYSLSAGEISVQAQQYAAESQFAEAAALLSSTFAVMRLV
jgi:C-terminal processing protease CtpA/Prc